MIYLKYLFFIYFAFLYQYGLNNKVIVRTYNIGLLKAAQLFYNMIYLKYLFFIYFAFLYQYGLNNKVIVRTYNIGLLKAAQLFYKRFNFFISSINVLTALTELSKRACSSSFKVNSIIFSTPFPPRTAGTPT